MRVPLSWLRDYVDFDLSVSEVDSLLTNAGLEVKTIDHIGVMEADLPWDRDMIVLGQVLNVRQHPDADRLVLADVDYGAAEPEQVVTGAPNLFAYIGQGDLREQRLFSPLALEGSTLYDGHKEGRQKMTLKGRPLRGIHNKAMLCSEKELGISEEHEGIILMVGDAHAPAYKPGTPLVDILGDAVLDIDIIPNVARAASIVGVARELAALLGQPLRLPDTSLVIDQPGPASVVIRTEAPELNPRFVAILIDGVTQKPSPYWLQYRLRLAGQRPINVVVDISNYVMLEVGQPNHTFDYDFLRARADRYAPDGPVEIITRLPHEGETLTTLDGVSHKLEPINILVTDPLGNLSLGGVMGGAESEIRSGTTRVLLEAAAWNFINIRRTANQLGIHTEAGFRFSRGVHPAQALLGAKRAARLMRDLAGGRIIADIIDSYPAPPEPITIRLTADYARRISGLDLSLTDMQALLERLEFGVEAADGALLVTTPDYRLDIEGPHDLVEELCRLVGYDKIPATTLADDLPPQRSNIALDFEERVKDFLVQNGLQEVITYRLTSPDWEKRLLVGDPDDRPYVTITNSNSPARSVMRHRLLGSVVEIAARNSRYQDRIALFEIGPVFLVAEDDPLPDETDELVIVLTGRRQPPAWSGDVTAKFDFYDLKGIIEQLMASLNVPAQFAPADHPSYHPGRGAHILFGDTEQRLGRLGELHPVVVAQTGLRVEPGQPVLVAEIPLAPLRAVVPFAQPFEPLSAYPAVREDLAVIVAAERPAAEVTDVIRKSGGFLLQDVTLFDLFEGEQIGAGQKSLAYHLTYQAPNRTLTDKDVAKLRGRIIRQLEQRLDARLRS